MAPSSRYPVLLDLAGRPCLVVGGGVVAERKVTGLVRVGAVVTVVAPRLTDRLAQMSARGEVVWVERVVEAHDLASAEPWAFVVAATDDPQVNAMVTTEGTARALLVNDATAPDGGPVALPAVHRAGPVTLAVATGGVHPGAAGWLRDLMAASLRPEHVRLVELLAEMRVLEEHAARPDWRRVVASGTLELIREGREAEAKERLEACL